MNKYVEAFLVKTRLFDGDKTLSLTSLMMMTLITKVALSPTLDWPIISALFLSLVNYNGKKWFARDKDGKIVEDGERLASLETEIKAVAARFNISGLGR